MIATLTIDLENGCELMTLGPAQATHIASARPPTTLSVGDQTDRGFTVTLRWPELEVSRDGDVTTIIDHSDETSE